MNGDIREIAVIGAGFMGTQIALRAASFGYPVRLYDRDPDALERCRKTIALFMESRKTKEDSPAPAKILEEAICLERDPATMAGADLVIEAVPEDLLLKQVVFAEIEGIVSPQAVIGTNSSSIPVSRIEGVVKRPERILNIHFSSPIEQLYYVEVMRGTRTSQDVVDRVSDWIRSIACLPLINWKECIGFVFNRVWHAARRDALKVWAEGYADFRDVDRAWMLFTKMPLGPFGIMDYIGLDVVWSVQTLYYEESGDIYLKPPQALKNMVDRGELGMKSGQGFYTWPTPEFLRPEFLKVGP